MPVQSFRGLSDAAPAPARDTEPPASGADLMRHKLTAALPIQRPPFSPVAKEAAQPPHAATPVATTPPAPDAGTTSVAATKANVTAAPTEPQPTQVPKKKAQKQLSVAALVPLAAVPAAVGAPQEPPSASTPESAADAGAPASVKPRNTSIKKKKTSMEANSPTTKRKASLKRSPHESSHAVAASRPPQAPPEQARGLTPAAESAAASPTSAAVPLLVPTAEPTVERAAPAAEPAAPTAEPVDKVSAPLSDIEPVRGPAAEVGPPTIEAPAVAPPDALLPKVVPADAAQLTPAAESAAGPTTATVPPLARIDTKVTATPALRPPSPRASSPATDAPIDDAVARREAAAAKAKALAVLASATTTTSSQADQCLVCHKRVYLMERVSIGQQKIVHKAYVARHAYLGGRGGDTDRVPQTRRGLVRRSCFKCHHCGTPLTMATYRQLEQHLYCNPHFNLINQLGPAHYHELRSAFESAAPEPPPVPPTPAAASASSVVSPTTVAPPKTMTPITSVARTVIWPRQTEDAADVDTTAEERAELREIEWRQRELQKRGVALEAQLRQILDASSEEEFARTAFRRYHDLTLYRCCIFVCLYARCGRRDGGGRAAHGRVVQPNS